ncbi:MAG TPA: hypothetical protein VGI63_08510 [Verrucomicrobiae bacterium]
MLKQKIGLIALLAGFAAAEALAGTLTSYTTGDVLLCFRKPGTYDLVVDAGQISSYTNVAPNTRITVNQYTGGQLGEVGTNGVSWSAFTWSDDYTLFITKPRVSLDTQTSPWLNKSQSSQQATAGRMATIITGAAENIAFHPPSQPALNTANAVVEEDNSVANPNYKNGLSYRDAIFGSGGLANFYTTFQGVPENTTLASFTDDGIVQRSDFYQVSPTGSGNAKFLGYFEIATNGMMTYVAYPSTTPVIKSITHDGSNQTTITYKAGLYGTYTLRGITSLATGTAQGSWTAIQTLTSGDTATHSTTFTDTDTIKFYTITAQ